MTTPQAAAILRPEWPKTPTREQTLQAWLDAKNALDAAKATEMELRSKVIEGFNFDPKKAAGTEYADLANGWRLKAVKKQNYNLDKDKTDAALSELEKSGSDGQFIADRLVKWKPDLSIAEYRKLNATHKAIIDRVLTVTPGSPSLELIEPK